MKMRSFVSKVFSLGLSLFFLLTVCTLAQAAISGNNNETPLTSGRSGTLWVNVSPDRMYMEDCNGQFSFGGGTGGYKYEVHSAVKLTPTSSTSYTFCVKGYTGAFTLQVWDSSGNTAYGSVNVLPASSRPQTRVGTHSSIERGQWGAVQNLGVLTVPAGKTAVNCSGSARILNANGVEVSREFSLYVREQNATPFTRDSSNRDFPNKLENMVFTAGNYVLSIGGAPGSSAEIGCEITP